MHLLMHHLVCDTLEHIKAIKRSNNVTKTDQLIMRTSNESEKFGNEVLLKILKYV